MSKRRRITMSERVLKRRRLLKFNSRMVCSECHKEKDNLQQIFWCNRDHIVHEVVTMFYRSKVFCRMSPETLHLAVGLFDSYLNIMSKLVSKDWQPPQLILLNLFNTVCLWIAIKFNETEDTTYCQQETIDHLRMTYIGNCWKWSDVLRMEKQVLRTLKFRIVRSTARSALQEKVNSMTLTEEDAKRMRDAFFRCDLTLLSHEFHDMPKSVVVETLLHNSSQISKHSHATNAFAKLREKYYDNAKYGDELIHGGWYAISRKHQELHDSSNKRKRQRDLLACR